MKRIRQSRWAWWVLGIKEGHKVLDGPHSTEQDADEKGFIIFKEIPFEKYYLRTIDRRSAGSALRHKLLMNEEDYNFSMANFYKPPITREQ